MASRARRDPAPPRRPRRAPRRRRAPPLRALVPVRRPARRPASRPSSGRSAPPAGRPPPGATRASPSAEAPPPHPPFAKLIKATSGTLWRRGGAKQQNLHLEPGGAPPAHGPRARRQRSKLRASAQGSKSGGHGVATTTATSIEQLLGDEAESLLSHRCTTIPVERLTLPGPDWVDASWPAPTGPARAAHPAVAVRPRPPRAAPATCRSCRWTRASSTPPAPPSRRTPTTSTRRTSSSSRSRAAATPSPRRFGVLGLGRAQIRAPHPVHRQDQPQRVPDVPEQYDQIMFGDGRAGAGTWARSRSGATIYFGSPESTRQIIEVVAGVRARARAGHGTVLWCYLRNAAFKTRTAADYHVAADLTARRTTSASRSRRTSSSRSCPRQQRRLQRARSFGKTDRARLRRADDRPPDRPDPLPGRQLLHGPHRR